MHILGRSWFCFFRFFLQLYVNQKGYVLFTLNLSMTLFWWYETFVKNGMEPGNCIYCQNFCKMIRYVWFIFKNLLQTSQVVGYCNGSRHNKGDMKWTPIILVLPSNTFYHLKRFNVIFCGLNLLSISVH